MTEPSQGKVALVHECISIVTDHQMETQLNQLRSRSESIATLCTCPPLLNSLSGGDHYRISRIDIYSGRKIPQTLGQVG